jgi:DNA-binding NtrC family response regulator
MVAQWSKLDEVNVLASAADWAWPQALRDIFQPRGVNLLVAEEPDDFVHIIANRRIHTTIVDMDWGRSTGLTTIRLIRLDYPLLPCILLTSRVDQDVLGQALQLDVFSVVGKPVDMNVLRELLNRLFLKRYNSNIFSE